MTVIFNDSTYTAVKSDQQHRFGRRYIATDLLTPDYVALAQAFHARATRAENPEALSAAISAAIRDATGPTVIEVPLPEREW